MSENLNQAMEDLVNGNSAGFTSAIEAELQHRIRGAIELEKVNVAASLFGGSDVEESE